MQVLLSVGVCSVVSADLSQKHMLHAAGTVSSTETATSHTAELMMCMGSLLCVMDV